MFTVRQFEARTLSWWADQQAVLDMEPPYQRRGGLWSRSDKEFLIDSILNKYDIPKLYIADFTFGPSPLNTSSMNYAVIDGKQRFEALFDFIRGAIALSSSFVFEEKPSLQLAGLSYSDLKKNYPSVASRFDNYNLTVMSVITDEEGRINELFVRLNRNKPLTGPEVRNAMKGVVPELTRSIASSTFIQKKISYSSLRGQDLDLAAKFLLVEFRGRLVETKKTALDRFVKEGVNASATGSDFQRAAKRVQDVLRTMSRLFIDNDPLLRRQGPMVPYYWLVRGTRDDGLKLLRPFLLEFERARAENRRLAASESGKSLVDSTLLRYEALGRSINDPGSIEGRFEILLRAFERFVHENK